MEHEGVHVICLHTFPTEFINPSSNTCNRLYPNHYQVWYLKNQHVFDLLGRIDIRIFHTSLETKYGESFYECLLIKIVVHEEQTREKTELNKHIKDYQNDGGPDVQKSAPIPLRCVIISEFIFGIKVVICLVLPHLERVLALRIHTTYVFILNKIY